MATYLLTWNPKKWTWASFDDDLGRFTRQGYLDDQWSCGLNKGIVPGDRLFLLRQGVEPKGIFASGFARSAVFSQPHWDRDHADAGKMANYVKVRFDHLLNPEEHLLPRSDLIQGRLSKMHWDVQMSGVPIREDVVEFLETEWANLLGAAPSINEFEPHAIEGTITESVRYSRGRSDRLRRQALEKANGICAACGTDYKRILKGKGVRVLQVHHLKQIASTDTPRLTKLSDLAVVCANCHMLIHSNPTKAMAIEKLRAAILR